MPKKVRRLKANVAMPTVNPHAAGMDIGAREIYVAVPADSDPEPVRSFTTFTDDLRAIADWLKACGVKTIAMETRIGGFRGLPSQLPARQKCAGTQDRRQ